MGDKEIRVGQLIAPFGPGSLYTDRHGTPHVICGLDHWFKRTSLAEGLVDTEDRLEFECSEVRLAELLRVDRFCRPPDYRCPVSGSPAPPNASLHIPALRFPSWYQNTKTGQMHRFNLHSERIPNPDGGGRWQPVRFVSVCGGGHIAEFPWKEWLGCKCSGDGDLVIADRGGSELSSIRVECRSCAAGRKGKSLAGTTVRPDVQQGEQSAFQKAGIPCHGDRPWLGQGANEPGCPHPLVGALINQTNLYFARTISSILLPARDLQDDTVAHLRNEIERDQGPIGIARTYWNMGRRRSAVALVQDELAQRHISGDSASVELALESLFEGGVPVASNAAHPAAPESPLLKFRRAEFNIIRDEVNDPERTPSLRVVPTTVPEELAPWFLKVNLVERLRETRVFYGFDRLEPNPNPLVGMPDTAMNQLFRVPPVQPERRWLPAIEVFGEGIFIELDETRIAEWQGEHNPWLRDRLDDGLIGRLAGVVQTLPPEGAAGLVWASKYYLVHSLAHVLINQLVFDCGYSTASLRERLYVSADAAAPMAGILIYTASGDSEGTLGGLVQLGRPARLGPAVRRALSRASWCSADPVCSEKLGSQGSRLTNLAACHACVLLPETSCETINHGLDRAMVVGTPTDPSRGFMAALLARSYALE